MASKGRIEKMKRNAKLMAKYADKRAALKAEFKKTGDPEFLFKLDALPRNGSPTRYRRHCQLTGRMRGNYRKFQISRIMLRDMALDGLIPGMRKASW